MRTRRTFGTLAAALLLLVAFTARAAEPVGAVAALEGRAEVLHAGGTGWAAIAAGDDVLAGDQLRTLADSKLKILFRDDSVVVLAPGSQLTVDEQVAGTAPSSKFSLGAGTLRALVSERYGESKTRFEVETPTAVAGVRGTEFIAGYDSGREETVVVGLSHVTYVRATADAQGAREVRLAPGQTTTVRRGSYPLAPAAVPPATLRSLQGATDLGAAGPAARGKRAEPAVDPRVVDPDGGRALGPEGQLDSVVDQSGVEKRRGPAPPPPPVPGPKR